MIYENHNTFFLLLFVLAVFFAAITTQGPRVSSDGIKTPEEFHESVKRIAASEIRNAIREIITGYNKGVPPTEEQFSAMEKNVGSQLNWITDIKTPELKYAACQRVIDGFASTYVDYMGAWAKQIAILKKLGYLSEAENRRIQFRDSFGDDMRLNAITAGSDTMVTWGFSARSGGALLSFYVDTQQFDKALQEADRLKRFIDPKTIDQFTPDRRRIYSSLWGDVFQWSSEVSLPMLEAKALIGKKDYEQAVSELREVFEYGERNPKYGVEVNPADPRPSTRQWERRHLEIDARKLLAECYIELGKKDKARETLEAAMAYAVSDEKTKPTKVHELQEMMKQLSDKDGQPVQE